MKLLLVAVVLSFAAYAASQTMINCYQCEAGVFDTTSSHILSGDNPCLMNPNSTTAVQTVTCPQSSQCYVKRRTVATLTYAIERGCWDNYDDKGDGDTCDEEEDDDCAGTFRTGTCFTCCNTNKCNGATGIHGFSVLALLPVAIAMFY